MNINPSAPDEPLSSGESGIRRSHQIGDILVAGIVTGCSTDIDLQVERPYRIKVSSNHIPGFALVAKQWMHGAELTPEGEQEVTRLFEVALALGDAVQANRAMLVDAFADWERQAMPLKRSIAEARENQTKVRREGATHQANWQNAVLKPAKDRLGQAEAALESAEAGFEARIARLLCFEDQLPGCTTHETVRQLLS